MTSSAQDSMPFSLHSSCKEGRSSLCFSRARSASSARLTHQLELDLSKPGLDLFQPKENLSTLAGYPARQVELRLAPSLYYFAPRPLGRDLHQILLTPSDPSSPNCPSGVS